MPADATLKAANIFLQRVENAAALDALSLYDEKNLKKASASWRIRILRARGRALAAQGMEQEAWAEFRKALAIEGGP